MKKFINFIRSCKPKAKLGVTILAVAAIMSQAVFATLKLNASAPRFNFMQNDYELLRGANLTKNEDVWKDPVAGNVGDTFQAIVYYHNGMIDTVAENTKIKVTIPKETTGKTAKLTASISADNATTVTDTVVNGKIVGLSGLTINLDENADLALVPNSVKWYPNQFQNTDVAVSLPYSQTGNEITTAGVNIGNINGCWDYAGYLVFNVKSSAKPVLTPLLSVDKTVRNISTKGVAYTDLTKAHANEVAEFKVEVLNNGQTNLENLILKDQLPAELSYISNSMVMTKDGQLQNLTDAVANQIFATGWNSGTLNINKKITLTFSAKAPSAIWAEKTVVNTFTATSGTLSKSDTAKVTLVPEIASIIKHKTAKNLTTGKDAIVQNVNGKNIQTVSAVAGDEIKYTLSTTNTVANTIAENYIIEDGIADILEYADVTSISNSGSVVAGTSGNDAMLVRWSAVSIAYNQPIIRTFTVKVKNPLPTNPQSGYHYDWQMYNVYGDEVLVTISKPTVPPVIPPTTPPIVVPEVKPAPKQLPKTGSDLSVIVAIAGLLFIPLAYRVTKF